MKESIRNKLETTRDRFEEISGLLADPDVIGDQNQFRELSKEYARLDPVIRLFTQYESLSEDIVAAEEMTTDTDADIRQMGQDELTALSAQAEALELQLQTSLIPPDSTR